MARKPHDRSKSGFLLVVTVRVRHYARIGLGQKIQHIQRHPREQLGRCVSGVGT